MDLMNAVSQCLVCMGGAWTLHAAASFGHGACVVYKSHDQGIP
jgi:hypothetical protein